QQPYTRIDGTIGYTVEQLGMEPNVTHMDVPEAGISDLLMMGAWPPDGLTNFSLEQSITIHVTVDQQDPIEEQRYVDVMLGGSVADWRSTAPVEPQLGPVVTLGITDVSGARAKYYDYYWVAVQVDKTADPKLSLFSIKSDQVDFNALT